MFTLFLTSLAMCSTLVGGYIAIAARHRIHLLMGLGAGVLLGAVFFDLLPEALSVAVGQGWNFRIILGIVLAGFLIFYFVERLLVLHACPEGDCTNEVHQHIGRLSSVGLIVHSTLDGAAIGAASLVNWRTGLLVALAVIAHDMSDGLNTISWRTGAPQRSYLSGLGRSCARSWRAARVGISAAGPRTGDFSRFRFGFLSLHGDERSSAGSSPAFTESDRLYGRNCGNRLYRRCRATDWSMTPPN